MAVYYKYLFNKRDSISDIEGMAYSYLIYKALNNPDFFNRETGKIDMVRVRSFLRSSFLDGPAESLELDLEGINKSKMAKEASIARSSVYTIIERLKEKGLVDKHHVSCPIELLDGHYIEYPNDTKLIGQQLVFYGFLLDRGRDYNDIVDTWPSRLAELFCTSEENVNFLISTLCSLGYVRRLGNHRLKIKRNHPGSSQ